MANVVTQWNPFIITNKGLELRQRSIATGAPITFNYAKIGQGKPSNPANIPSMTDIVSAAEQVPVVRSVSDGVTHYVGIRIDNVTFKQPVLMTEIGLFASIGGETPVLYGYTYATQGYDSIPAGNISHYIWTVSIDTVISRAQSISFTYDGSKVYASEAEIDALIQAWEAYKDDVGSDDLHGAVNQHSTDIGYLFKVAENNRELVMNVELKNTETEPLWFNNSAATVAFPSGKNRNNLDYTVQSEIVKATGGDAGEIVISAKQLNGFTVGYTGTASAVTLKLYVKGGLWKC
ncbi:MAG: hypothetical protein NC401_16810 [Ruminococcus sp.]|nr:hypothetical protein [Ruminococcus sp.]